MPTLRRLRLRSGWVWQIDYRDRGRRVRRLVGSDRRQAERRLAQVIRALEAGEPVRLAPGPTLADAAEAYLAQCRHAPRWLHQKRQVLADLARRVGAQTPLAALTPYQIDTWLAEKAKATSPRTANIYGNVLRALLRQARRWGWVQAIPDIPRFREAGPRQQYFTPEQFRALLDATPPKYRPLWLFLAATGLRIGEALALRWDQVEKDRMRLWNEKADRWDVLPLPSAVRAWFPAPQTHCVFPYSRIQVRRVWQAARRQAGLSTMRLHDLRRTLGAWLIRDGVSLRIVQQILRHRSYHLTASTYTPLDLGQVEAALEGVAGKLGKFWSNAQERGKGEEG